MKIGVYFCRCGGIITEKIDGDAVGREILGDGGAAYFESVELACGEADLQLIEQDLRDKRPDAVVIAACSPRDHEDTFRRVVAAAGMNPYLMQMVNIREHIAWVTPDREDATRKTVQQLRAAIARVRHHEALDRQEYDASTDTLVIGGGPAGLKAALSLAEAGRKVVLVEKGPILGGAPVRYEDVFPRLECGPCVLEPFIAEVLHGPHADHIETLLLSDVVGTVGSFGNFTVTIRKAPRRRRTRPTSGSSG